MGRLIKNQWARLIVLSAAAFQVAAAIEGFFWPKFFFDWLTKNFDPFVKPIPILQIINIVFGFAILAYEWPLSYIAAWRLHGNFEARFLVYPLSALFAVLMYQGTNAALYYVIGVVLYMWGYSEGENIAKKPWTIPKPGPRTSKA